MRLFVAVTPPAEIRDRLLNTYSDIARARWVKKEHLHVTMRFIGEVEEEVAGVVREALCNISSPAIEIKVEGVGTFGRPARTLWCSLAPRDALSPLADAIERAVVGAGLPAADRPFEPHLTLARFKNSPPVLVRRYLEDNEKLETPVFSISEFTLYQSKLSSAGPEYSVMQSYPLGARS